MADTGKKIGVLESLVRKIPADFGRTRPEIHNWIFTPVVLAQLAWVISTGHVGLAVGAGLFGGGIFLWTLLEYLLHRFSFHSHSEHPLIRPFNSGLHLLHHRDPASKLYVAAPILMAAPVYSLTFLFFRLLSGSTERAAVMGSGLICAFLFYEYVHYMSHQKNPKSRALKYLKKHHMQHHFGDESHKFGVTSPLWDVVFGTLRFKERTDNHFSAHRPPGGGRPRPA